MASQDASNVVFKAYDLLSEQPLSIGEVDRARRSEIIVSAVADARGTEHALSRFGDSTWNLEPFFAQSNVIKARKSIKWPTDAPTALVEDCKAVAYAWFKRGFQGAAPPIAGTVRTTVMSSAIPMVRQLAGMGIVRFDQLRTIHTQNWIQGLRNAGADDESVYRSTKILDLLWEFREECLHPLRSDPWSGITRSQATMKRGWAVRTTGKTAIIPQADQALVFTYCEKIVADAAPILARLESGEMNLTDSPVVRIRDCVLYLLSITSGMRNEEAIGVQSGDWRSEVKNGVEYHWVATVEHKTGKGRVEYLIPKITIDALELLRRYARPFQEKISNQIVKLSKVGSKDPIQLLRLAKARQDEKRIFLALDRSGGNDIVGAISLDGAKYGFQQIAKEAGSGWKLLPHQCRRTYARNFVESRMGRASLVFLKWQFKHSSMSMTQLYASNPIQDQDLFDEIYDEMTSFKIDLIESWLGDAPLSGGAGRQIMKMRAIPIKDRESLLGQTASQVHIRATGHGWCLAQERGCGGAGLYEATRCVGCKSGVIDESFGEVWQGIGEQQRELLELDDVGPAVKQRAERDAKWASQVIDDLKREAAVGGPLEKGHGEEN